MAQPAPIVALGTPNVGTLVGAAIRPINTADLISTAYANEIKGGIHGYATLSQRNNIIIERRQWGMLVTVYDDPTPSNNKTYQLKYDNVNTDLMDPLNWVEYTGASSTNISEWQNSVKSILTTKPTSPNDGDRYLVGIDQSSTITGSPWQGNIGGFISEYNAATTNWTNTNPTNGMTIRVDDQDNSLYKYEGDYSTGQWIKEKLTQVYSVDFTGNGLSYSTTTSPTFSQYENDVIFLSKFDVSNTANVSVNINGIGTKGVKKPSINGLIDLLPNDILEGNIYTLSYDNVNDCFQFYKNYSNDAFNIKYYIEPTDYIVVPPYCQYWVYGDLTVDGTIVNYGQVIVANGELIIGSAGVVQNFGDVDLITIGGGNSNVDFSAINGDLIPSIGNTYDIGATAGYTWKDLYLSGNTIYLGDSVISSSGGQVLFNNSPVGTGLPGATGATGPAGVFNLVATFSSITATNSTFVNLHLTPTTRPTSPTNGDIYFNGTSSYIHSGTWSRVNTNDKNTIIVQKSGGDFTSIRAAVESITDSSTTNKYVINVGPGDFYENTINFTNKPYISVVGSDIQTTKIIAATTSQNLFVLNDSVNLSFMTLKGVGTGYSAIVCQDLSANPTGFSLIHKVSFYDCHTNVLVKSNTLPTSFYGEYIDFNGNYKYGVRVESNNGVLAFANLESYFNFPGVTGSIASYVTGTNSVLNVLGSANTGFGNDKAFFIRNGANLTITSCDITGYERGIEVENFGTASTFDIDATSIVNCTYNMYIDHPYTFGTFQGSNSHAKIYNQSSSVYWGFLDNEDGEFDVTRKISITNANGSHVDISTLILEGSAMGVLDGGDITISTGLTISISAGYGYLEDSITKNVLRIDWPTTSFSVTNNSANYIYRNKDNFLQSSTLPNIENNIVFGRVITQGGSVILIDASKVDVKHVADDLKLFNRNALGSIYDSGSIVTSATYSLSVTDGSYYFGSKHYLPTGGTGITFSQFVRNNASWTITNTNVVTSQYDNNSGLTGMSASYFTKHTLYVTGSGINEKYLLVVGQTQYDNINLVETAPLPTPPTYFIDAITPIASIVVRQGTPTIYEILDIRPVIGFKSTGVNSSSLHSNLIGLSSDDHTQYLLVSGSRAMAGNLVMASNSITGVNQINGVDIESHASRHLPNGSDSLATGVPSPIGTTNQIGGANAFARQDHIHAHGNQSGGSLHATASQSTEGFMSAVDKTKLDNLIQYVNITFTHAAINPVSNTTYNIGVFPQVQPFTNFINNRAVYLSQYTGRITDVSIVSDHIGGSTESSTFRIFNITQATSSIITNTLKYGTGSGTTTITSETFLNSIVPAGWTLGTNVSLVTGVTGYLKVGDPLPALPAQATLDVPINGTGFDSINVTCDIARFGTGAEGPMTIQYSLDNGATYITAGNTVNTINTSTYVTSTVSFAASFTSNMKIRFLATVTPGNSTKRLRNVVISGTTITPLTFNNFTLVNELPVNVGDYLIIRWNTPSWVTAPTSVVNLLNTKLKLV